MIVNREGRFRAAAIEAAANETGPNKLATETFRFALEEELQAGEWVDVAEEGLDIVAYCYIEKKDGTLNDFQIEALQSSFGWGGSDMFWFEENLRELPKVQLTLEEETYEGKTRIKVRFINAYDSEPGGVSHADDATRKSISTRLGSDRKSVV